MHENEHERRPRLRELILIENEEEPQDDLPSNYTLNISDGSFYLRSALTAGARKIHHRVP